MPNEGALNVAKKAAAAAAVAEVRANMVVGLGTGSTAAFAVHLLAQKASGGLRFRGVATSKRTEVAARAAGIEMMDLVGLTRIDLCIDGVDEIDPGLQAVKGAGGAMLIEKIVASMAMRNIAIADSTKLVDQLGNRPVPVEVLPSALAFVSDRIARLNGEATERAVAGVPFVTDSANHILDCRFAPSFNPRALAVELSAIPGVLGHGLFLGEIDALYVASGTQVQLRERKH